MGGDHAPAEIVAGAMLANAEGDGKILLVGERAAIAPLLNGPGADGIEIVEAAGAVAMDEHPSHAVRRADQTSLGVAVNLVRDGSADAVVSAGNSGAFLAIALIRLRTIAGIARPAIAAVLPALRGPVVLIDAGANVDCRPEWLLQFGIMGAAYAQAVLGTANPRVGVISVGEERTKGNAVAIEAAALLEASPLTFVGNVEGKDLLETVADVVVCDGFVGNVILKFGEGVVAGAARVVVEELRGSNPLVKVGALLVKPALKRLRARFDYETYGGAPLLGVRGNCIVTHGRATRHAIRNAIRSAATESNADVVGKIAALVDPLVAREA